MKVLDQFTNIQNLKERLACRDAITINGDVYMINHDDSSPESLTTADVYDGEEIIDISKIANWEYDEDRDVFINHEGDEIQFFDLEVYEP